MILPSLWPGKNGHALIENLGFLVQEPEEEYRSRSQEYVDSDQLGDFRENAFLFHKRQRGLAPQREPSNDVVERAVASRVLFGRDHYESSFATGGPIDPSTGKPYSRYSSHYERWAASHGKPTLTAEEAQAVDHIDFGVRAHDTASVLLSNGVAMGIVRGDYCGVACQARVDWLNPHRGVVALVPCRDLDNADGTIRRHGPAHRLAFHHGLIAAVTGRHVPAHIIVFEKDQPHRCGVWAVSRLLLAKIRRENEQSLRRLAECRRLNRWPTGYEKLRILAPSII